MLTDIEQEKSLLSKPGDTLQETLEAIGMSQRELAERMGRPDKTINEIITGKTAITSETALQLEKVLGVPSSFWLKLEYNYRDELARLHEKERLAGCFEWLKLFPLTALKRLGWIPDITDKAGLVDAVLKFFRVATPDEWNRIYRSTEVTVAYRMPLATANEPGAISAWLRQGELQADELTLPTYDKTVFREKLNQIRGLVKTHPTDYKQQLQALCQSAGVAVVYTPNLPKATPCGAARWYGNHPLIQLSGRYKTNDSFWFTFFHEAGHIIEHGKKDVFIEDVKGIELNDKQEHEANAFASHILLPDELFQQFTKSATFTEASIRQFAERNNTHPAIIVGRLEHRGLINHNRFRYLKEEVSVA